MRFFGPLRVSESQSTRRKAAAIEKVIESVKQAVSSSYSWSESIINKDNEIYRNAQLQIEMVKYM